MQKLHVTMPETGWPSYARERQAVFPTPFLSSWLTDFANFKLVRVAGGRSHLPMPRLWPRGMHYLLATGRHRRRLFCSGTVSMSLLEYEPMLGYHIKLRIDWWVNNADCV